MTTGRINQNATCFCWLSGAPAAWWDGRKTAHPSSPAVAQTHRFRAFDGTERIHNARRQPVAARAAGRRRTAEEEEEEKEERRRHVSLALSLSLSFSPARIPRAERHSIDTSASISRPVKPYTIGRQRAECTDPATR